jgi:hypothetical protein
MRMIYYYLLKLNLLWLNELNGPFRVFEGIFGHTINFAKSEMIPLNLDDSVSLFYAQLGCLSNTWELNCIVRNLLSMNGN